MHQSSPISLVDTDRDVLSTSWWRRAALVLTLWLAGASLLAIVLTAQEGLSFLWSFESSFLQCGILVVLINPVWALLPRLDGKSGGLKLLVHAVLAIVLVAVWELGFHAFLSATAGPEVASIRSETSGYWRWLQAGMMYGVVVAGMVVVRTARKLRLEERRAGQLRLLMREAELRALRAQLRPHFLFNTLNSIYSLIPDRPEEAKSMVAGLSDLMRETLEVTDQSLVPLATELRLVESYLGIESVRFGERLTVSVEVDPKVKQALVPPLLLQPLVENAVHHGIAAQVEGGEITVTAQLTENAESRNGQAGLRLMVRDTGVGFSAGPTSGLSAGPNSGDFETGAVDAASHSGRGRGNGLRITRSRLENQYGESFSLEVGNVGPSGEGAVITIDLPLESS